MDDLLDLIIALILVALAVGGGFWWEWRLRDVERRLARLEGRTEAGGTDQRSERDHAPAGAPLRRS